MTVQELILNKDYDCISWRLAISEAGEEGVFAGVAKSEGGKLIPLDGDTYNVNAEVVHYEEWENLEEGISAGLTVVVKVK